MFFPVEKWRFFPVFFWMVIIFVLSHQPGDAIELIDIPNADKVLHCLVYAILAYATLFAVSLEKRQAKPVTVAFLVILFCFAYGISDEYHQSFIPGRFPSKWDIAADTMGAIIAVISWFRYIESYIKEKKS